MDRRFVPNNARGNPRSPLLVAYISGVLMNSQCVVNRIARRRRAVLFLEPRQDQKPHTESDHNNAGKYGDRSESPHIREPVRLAVLSAHFISSRVSEYPGASCPCRKKNCPIGYPYEISTSKNRITFQKPNPFNNLGTDSGGFTASAYRTGGMNSATGEKLDRTRT